MNNNWKSTLNMPDTKISMRANLNDIQFKYFDIWKEKNIYKKILSKRKEMDKFILHDGPIYANGLSHIGHAMNKILKDIIVRFKSMQGFYTPFLPGWDSHGLPIENKMLSELKKSKDDFKPIELRKEAAKYAKKQVENQKEQFKTFGLLHNFDKFYITLDSKYEAAQLEIFQTAIKKNLVFRDKKPIYWSPTSETALAEAEIEYHIVSSPSVFIAFNIVKGNDILTNDDELIIWTTTPWTIIANAAIAVGKDIEYSLINHNSRKIVLASQLITNFINDQKIKDHRVIKTFLGSEILNIKYIHPISKKELPIVEGHHVSIDAGSGLVHIAPYFGEDDFIIGKKEKLEKIMHVNDKGFFNKEAGEFESLYWLDANKNIGLKLKELNRLLSLKFIKHSYPHDWRTHKPIMFRATNQWFISIEKIKDKILKAIDSIKTYPQWAKEKLIKMIKNRNDWCISRQRIWGVPIPIFYDKNNEPIIDEEIMDHVIKLVKKHGTDIWYEWETDKLLPSHYRKKELKKETDIMDVWFDSGSSFLASFIDEDISAPFDLYLEGIDQFRGWFNSSLIASVIHNNSSPYKNLLSHGFIVDSDGNKMSKSKGNVIDPFKIIKNDGIDILRLWVSNSDYFNDVSISDEIIKQTKEVYRKIRNSMRFMDGNLFDFDSKIKIEFDGIHLLINEKIENLKFNIYLHYQNYEFNKIIKDILNFLNFTSSFYFEISKDSLYIEKNNSKERLQVQNNIYNIFNTLIVALAPIMPVTMEDLYQNSNLKNKQNSVHLLDFFKKGKISNSEEKKWEPFFDLKNKIYKLLEEAKINKIISRTNEADVTFNIPNNDFIKTLNLEKLLLVAKISFGDKNMVNKLENSQKCLRCWNHFEDKNMFNEEICTRCNYVINTNEEN